MSTIRRTTWKQRGMVSILVTMLLMIVISLIVLGFAQIARRNQRQTVDRQLSTQAFYAAETGINDARKLIQDAIDNNQVVQPKPDCTGGSGATAAFYGSLVPSLGTAVSYTCLIVDPTPTTLVYNNVGTGGTVIPLTSASGVAIANVRLTTLSKDTTATPTNGCPTAATALPTASAWTAGGCGYGVLRVDLVRTTGTFTLGSLQESVMTSFFIPQRTGGGNSVAFPAAAPIAVNNRNNRYGVACTNSGCTVNITGLSASQYHLRVQAVYKDMGFTVSATDSGGNPLALQGAQAVVDATGKAQDVLRRVQVRVPLTASTTNQWPDYALQTTDAICKRFSTMAGYFNNAADDAVAGLDSVGSPVNPLCRP